MNRRDFLKFIGMASGATVLSSCGIEKSTEKIIPRIIPPEDPDYIPGEPMFRNSTCTECPAGCGTTVRIVDFNPIKLEGVENHPLNDGALCVRGQSSLMRLYHPERLKTPLLRLASDGQTQAMSEKGFRAISWDEASQLIIDKMQVSAEQGKRNTYLSGLTNSSLSQLIDEFCGSTNVERLTEYETFDYANLREANRIVFGRDEIPAYKIEEADFLLTLGADIIETFITPVNHAVQLKKAKESHDFRWFHIEPHVSMTGFKANRKMTIRPGGEIYLMVYLVNVIITNKLDKNSLPSSVKSRIPQVSDKEVVQNTGFSEADLEQITQALINSRNPLLIAGGVSTAQSTGLETAVLAGQVQWMLGMTDTTIDFGQAQNLANLGTLLDVQQLSDSLSNNEIGVLFVTRSNPLATVPGNLGLNDNFPNADFKVAFSDFVTETAAECDLILPLSHSYESWGDVQPHKGLTNVIRPVIKPLYQTETEGDILIKLSQRYANRQSDRTYEQWLKEKWTAELGQADMEKMIERGYHRTEMPPVSPNISAQSINRFLNDAQYDSAPSGAVLFALPSIRTYDGRSKVLPLTLEVPDPLTTISYGNWVSLSEEDASEIGVLQPEPLYKDRTQVSIEAAGSAMALGTMVQKGLPKDVMTVHRDQLNVDMLSFDKRSGQCFATVDDFTIVKTNLTEALAIQAGALEQGHRNIIPKENGEHHGEHHIEGEVTLYPEVKYPDYRWSMAIDLESCIGCAACVAACYVENNIPVVGKDEHLKGREMSWIRIQPYYHDDGSMDTLVMLCQHCGQAPCEHVCPVYATYHSHEGLNVMVYNRCVGTRYCHNNCPYKVRRFNWFDWTDEGAWQEPISRMLNPEVWTRPKGVMEKCTFCVQRIRRAKHDAKDEERKVRDGEVTPACAQTCPTDAITFGNILDEESEVYKKSQSDRKFQVLELLGTNPAIHYLRKEEKA